MSVFGNEIAIKLAMILTRHSTGSRRALRIADKVEGYNVTLMGQVSRSTLEKDVENVVKKIEGVEQVDNQIEVLPTSNMDDQLSVALYRAIYGFSSMERYAMLVIKPIRIIVK